MTKNTNTHTDWKEEIAYIIRHDITHVQASNSKYKNQLTAVVLIKYFTQLLADARREVIGKLEQDIIGFEINTIKEDAGVLRTKHLIDWYNGALLKVRIHLATLREEGVAK